MSFLPVQRLPIAKAGADEYVYDPTMLLGRPSCEMPSLLQRDNVRDGSQAPVVIPAPATRGASSG